MSQITKKAIAENAVDGSKIRLANSQRLRARNFENTADVDLFELNNVNEWIFVSLPKHLGSNLATESYVDTVVGTLTTDDITESTNLYYTQQRFDSALSAKSTDDLSEGVGNLYFSDLRAKTAVVVDMNGDQADQAPSVSSVKSYVSSVVASGGSMEIFNHTIHLNALAGSLTGLNYFCAPSVGTISHVKIQIWTKNGVASGILSMDLKKNTSPANLGMTSLFTTQPSIDFATASDYASASGVLATTTFNEGDFLRLDITSIPVGFVGTITVVVKA